MSSSNNCTINEERACSTSTSGTFVCGVVEGFYGRPWTAEQRHHLFSRLGVLRLNTYFYAPKDDLKHRLQWRVLFDESESEVIKNAIFAAKQKNIDFVFALSPGNDIVYSDRKDIECIKEKFAQVRALGCQSFALLFDDIEKEMKEKDKELFSTFASAQVAVTNEVYDYLGAPTFFFCPTEYCETRASPSLMESEYLDTIGRKLINAIRILWTGYRVVNKDMTVEHMKRVARVLRRKPIIWDNLHANDYDQKRLFMGPFSGRSVLLKEEIDGLLLNPNCKYEANFVPIHTLSDWNECTADAPESSGPDPVLDAGGESPVACRAVDSAKPFNVYHPLSTLRKAIAKWLPEFKNLSGPCIPPVPRVDVPELSADSTSEVSSSSDQPLQLRDVIQSAIASEGMDDMEPVNSLSSEYVEPMPVDLDEQTAVAEAPDESSLHDRHFEYFESPTIKQEHLNLIVDMFFLPFENGRRAVEILEQYSWLVENSEVMVISGGQPNDEVKDEWMRRFQALSAQISTMREFFRLLSDCPNKALVSELITFVWEAHGACSVLMAVLNWISCGFLTSSQDSLPRFWQNVGDDEPWCFHGGFVQDVYRLLANDRHSLDLYLNKGLLPCSVVDYTIEAVKPEQYADLGRHIAKGKGSNGNGICFERYLNWLSYDGQFVFAVYEESVPDPDNRMLICYAVASLVGRKVSETIEALPHGDVDQEEGNALHRSSSHPEIPEFVFNDYPSWMELTFELTSYEAVPAKRLLHSVATCLAMSGSTGFFTTVPSDDPERIQYYLRIGLVQICQSNDEKFCILGHSLLNILTGDEVSSTPSQ